MSTVDTTPIPAPTARTRTVPVRASSVATMIRSEWIKLTTLRSTWIVLAVAFLGTIAVGGAVAANTAADWNHMHPGELAHFNAIDDSLTGIQLAQLAIGVLGVLVISGEYATGMIRSSLAAAPRRTPVLIAKLVVFLAMTAVVATAATLIAFFVGQAFLGTHGVGFGAAHAARAVFGGAFYLIAVAALAVALGFIVRSTAGGIAALVALLLVIPAIGDALPTSWQSHVIPYLPSNAGASLYTVHQDSTTALSPLAGLVVLLVWCAVAVTAAGVVLRRRDA